MDDLTGKQLDALINTDAPPYCPRCGSLDGFLGTQGLYFVCKPCGGGNIMWFMWYCKEADKGHTRDLSRPDECGKHSPFYRPSRP